MKNKKEIVLLFLPIFVLLVWVISLHYSVSVSPRTRIPVQGYDPRDILAGRYMRLQTDYSSFETECQPRPKRAPRTRRVSNRRRGGVDMEVKTESSKTNVNPIVDAFFCVDEKKIYAEKKPENCELFIKGKCYYERFDDDVSRFYVPELNALELEKLLRNRKVSTQIELSVSKEGRALPVDLFFDGISYKQFLK